MKMKLFITALLILNVAQKNFSQYSQEWVARYSGLSSDEANSLAVDNTGNVYVTGSSSNKYLTVKYNSRGNEIWTARYNGLSIVPFDLPHSMAVDNYNNVYVTGEARGFGYNHDYTTIKYDMNGNQLWVKLYNSPENVRDAATSLAIDNFGNVYVTGYTVFIHQVCDYRYNTIKYDSSGNEIWNRVYCSHGDYVLGGYPPPSLMTIDSSGNVYVTGFIDSTYTFNFSLVTIKYNSNGIEQWIRRYDGNFNPYIHSIDVDNRGNVYIIGQNWTEITTIKYNSNGDTIWIRNADFNSRPKEIAVDNSGNIYVAGTRYPYGFTTIKYDSNGAQMWVVIDTTGDDLNSMTIDINGNIYSTGNTHTSGNNDYYTVMYSPNGNKIWSSQYNGPAYSSDIASDISVDNLGNIFVTGSSIGIGTNSDYATIKYSTITNSNNNITEVTGFKLHQNYPNPFNPNTIINYELPLQNKGLQPLVLLKVYDVLGNEVATLVNEKQSASGGAGSYSVEFNGANFPSGIYYYKIEADNFSEVRKMILLK